ncbi:S-layer family protein, partial [Roseomonas genomospecies 6]
PVNDTPAAAITGTYAVDEDGSLALGTGLSVSDGLDVPFGGVANATVSVTVGVAHGTLTLGGATGTLTGSNSVATLTLSGTLADVNAALQRLTYAPARDYSGTDTLTLTVNDGGNGGTGALSNTATKTITVNPVSDIPNLTINGTLNPSAAVAVTGTEDVWFSVPLVLSETDADGSETLSYTIAGLPNGARFQLGGTQPSGSTDGTLIAGGASISAGSIGDGATNTIWLRLPADWNTQGGSSSGVTSPLTLTVTASSKDGSATAATRAGTIALTVASAEDNPRLQNDSASVTEDTTLTATGNALTNDTEVDEGQILRVSQVQFGAQPAVAVDTANDVDATIAGAYGTLTIRRDGTYSYALNNAAVQDMRTGQTRTEVFTLTVDDFLTTTGANAAGAAQTSTLTVTIHGTDDAPVVDLDGTAGNGVFDHAVTFTEQEGADSGANAVALFPSNPISDVDSAKLTRVVITVTGVTDGASEIVKIGGTDYALNANGSGTATVGGTSLTVTMTNNGGTITVTRSGGGLFTVAEANTLLSGITYRNTSNTPTVGGTRSFTVQATDAGSNDAGGTNQLASNSPRTVVTVVATNDRPVVDLNGSGVTGLNSSTTLTEAANAATTPVAFASGTTLLTDRDDTKLRQMVLTVDGLVHGNEEVIAYGGSSIGLGSAGTYSVTAGGVSLTIAVAVVDGDTTTLTVTPTAPATAATFAVFETLLKGLTYTDTNDDPTNGGANTTRTITVRVTDDGANGTLAPQTNTTDAVATITITPINDQPRITGLSGTATFGEDAIKTAARLDADGAIVLDDPDSGAY